VRERIPARSWHLPLSVLLTPGGHDNRICWGRQLGFGEEEGTKVGERSGSCKRKEFFLSTRAVEGNGNDRRIGETKFNVLLIGVFLTNKF
jgi:hypothetical protein